MRRAGHRTAFGACRCVHARSGVAAAHGGTQATAGRCSAVPRRYRRDRGPHGLDGGMGVLHVELVEQLVLARDPGQPDHHLRPRPERARPCRERDLVDLGMPGLPVEVGEFASEGKEDPVHAAGAREGAELDHVGRHRHALPGTPKPRGADVGVGGARSRLRRAVEECGVMAAATRTERCSRCSGMGRAIPVHPWRVDAREAFARG